ncbi:hypothetical protein B0I35DRAFT_443558 [Stachybotrys elegans]|uniref:NADH:flavin oxidoreductase/NADH oxidase N-terminal domain-containing protein n=1 Tax=Stachybotrys elegans TaxID=80388 RepID=A0A8K0WLT1_9HYPO|nr:hypothetical protein B0I35DRAFT_443558 [Stachybotrys elegans]
MASSKLFQPIKVGQCQLEHRIVMPPLTRCRADAENVILPEAVEYYTQRACVPGGLIVAEATHISPRHCARRHLVGVWTKPQIEGWRKVVDAVHAKGCRMFCQLIAPGRAGHWLGEDLVSSSPTPMEIGAEVPREMTEAEIWQCVADFAQAAKNCMEAGFDGIELHGANGYLIDQFLQDVCNVRTDSWGSSVENRSRFLVEVTKAVCEAIGSDRVGVRLSPWNKWQGMKMEVSAAEAQFSDAVTRLKPFNLAYLHLIESRVVNNIDCERQEGLEFALKIWDNQSPVILAGGYNASNVNEAVNGEYAKYDVLVSIGRFFVSNPDLVYRIRKGLPLTAYDRTTFYITDPNMGYKDYEFSKDFSSETEVQG